MFWRSSPPAALLRRPKFQVFGKDDLAGMRKKFEKADKADKPDAAEL
jgi:hypothetical protein